MRLLSNLHVKGKPAVLPDRAIRRQSHYFIFRPRIVSENHSPCFRWYPHPSSGAHTTVPTASGICHIITAICCYYGKVPR